MGIPSCINPVVMEDFEKLCRETYISSLTDRLQVERINNVMPYILDFEPLSLCAGSCMACFSNSNMDTNIMVPWEKAKEIIDDAFEMGARAMSMTGGDPLLYPHWQEMALYARDKGYRNVYLSTAGLISKEQAREIVRLGDAITSAAHHLDTVNQEAYNRSHYDPKTLSLKKQGYRNLLEAGYPPERVTACLTLTKPSAQTIGETIDWMVDEMGAKEVMILIFKPEGLGGKHPELEPSLSEVRKALEYRAKKLGKEWFKVGTSDAGIFCCRTIFGVTYRGDVIPCLTLEKPVGNVYKERLKDIIARSRDELFYNFQMEGPCGYCEYKKTCFGCRATAYHYTGNVKASDPKCFMNTEAKEYYLK